MFASILLLVAALAQSAGASRVPPHALAPGTFHAPILPGSMIHPPAVFPRISGLQMQMGRIPRIEEVDLQNLSRPFRNQGSNAGLEAARDNGLASSGSAAQEGNSSTHLQLLPPDKLYSMDVSEIARAWRRVPRVGLPGEDWDHLPYYRTADGSYFVGKRVYEILFQKMVDDIRKDKLTIPLDLNPVRAFKKRRLEAVGLKRLRRLEAVGLMSNDPSDNPDGMMALGFLSREKLKDDSTGSLLKVVETQFGIEATRGMFGRAKKRIPAFVIKGLVEAPFFTAPFARVLLAKIAEWALAEQKLLVGPTSVDPDVAAYYMLLGFEKVEMDDGSYQLVYAYPDIAQDSSTRGGHRMVGLTTDLFARIVLRLAAWRWQKD